LVFAAGGLTNEEYRGFREDFQKATPEQRRQMEAEHPDLFRERKREEVDRKGLEAQRDRAKPK
jgi:hypothetical protein